MPIFIEKQEKKPVLWVDLLITNVISGSNECVDLWTGTDVF